MRLALHAEWTKLCTQPGMAALLIGAVVLTVRLSTGVAATATTASASDPAKLALTGVYLGQVVVGGPVRTGDRRRVQHRHDPHHPGGDAAPDA
jgi:hypothetical protein